MNFKQLVSVLLTASLVVVSIPPASAGSASTSYEVTVPIGTKVYCELDQRVESKKKDFQVGDRIRVRVWRDVVVDGEVVISRGSPIDARISMLKKAKVAGRKGKLEIAAESVTLADGRELPLSGGYGKQGKGRKALSITLFALVAWPLIFLKGKKAVLEPGTLFDAYTDQPISIALKHDKVVPKLNLMAYVTPPMDVEILYQEMEGDAKIQNLPMSILVCDELPDSPLLIDRINGNPIAQPLPIKVGAFAPKDDCQSARATVAIKPLVKLFRKGINRFQVSYGRGEDRVGTEVILDIQI